MTFRFLGPPILVTCLGVHCPVRFLFFSIAVLMFSAAVRLHSRLGAAVFLLFPLLPSLLLLFITFMFFVLLVLLVWTISILLGHRGFVLSVCI